MPRYFFNIKGGPYQPNDQDGTDLKGVERARSEAVSMAGEML